MSDTFPDGALVIKDPADIRTYRFNWDDHLADTAALSAAGTITVTAVYPTESPLTLTAGSPALVSGNRAVDVVLTGGRGGTRYNVAHKVVTNETPAQTIERSFDILVQDR